MTPQTPETHGDASQAPEATTEGPGSENVTEANSEAAEVKRLAVLRIIFLLPV